VDAARAALDGFLVAAVAAGCKCVRIVHGKGYHRADCPPILKPRVAHWLAHASEVVAYVSALPNDGGTGALYVLLKRQREHCTPR
jgi:DNA-nicking Smr family endonuclease